MSVSSSYSSCSSASADADSAFGDRESESPAQLCPDSIGATLDGYVCAAKVGRAAFACGDLKLAVEQFDHALEIELQTELECMYDTSLGYVSGLVRKEVDSRLHLSPVKSVGPPSCDKVLEELAQAYEEAERQSEARPTEAKWYLHMGAALCLVNEWDKARKIYKEGLSVCKDKDKDKKELRRALRNLIKIEQITTGELTPDEPYRPPSPKLPQRPKPTRLNKRKRSYSMSSKSKKADKMRPKSQSIEFPLTPDEKDTLSAVALTHTIPKQRTTSDPPTPRKKRFSFGHKLAKRPSAVAGIDVEERLSWLNSFLHIAGELQDFRPSAIAQMRRLSLDSGFAPQSASHKVSSDEECDLLQHSYTDAVKFTSMRIESDDSELEDD